MIALLITNLSAAYRVQKFTGTYGAEVLKKTGVVKLESNAVHKAVKKVQWHGRMEQIADSACRWST